MSLSVVRPLAIALPIALMLAACGDSTAPTPMPVRGESVGQTGPTTVAAGARIIVNNPPAFVEVGRPVYVTATVRNAVNGVQGSPMITWTTSDQTIAEARDGSGNGVQLVGKRPGAVTLTANAGSLRAAVRVVVRASESSEPSRPVAAANFWVSPTSRRAIPGMTVQFRAVATDAFGRAVPGLAITWAVRDPRVAQITGGAGDSVLVTARAPGVTQITATLNGVTMTGVLIVEPPGAGMVSFVSVTPNVVRLAKAGDTVTVASTVHESSGEVLAGQSVEWLVADGLAYGGVPQVVEIVRAWTAGSTHYALLRAKAVGVAQVQATSGTAWGTGVVAVGTTETIYLP